MAPAKKAKSKEKPAAETSEAAVAAPVETATADTPEEAVSAPAEKAVQSAPEDVRVIMLRGGMIRRGGALNRGGQINVTQREADDWIKQGIAKLVK